MDFIKQWTLTICITLIISVIFGVLSPKGNSGKLFKAILSIFILLSFIIPITKYGGDIKYNFNSYSSVTADESQIYQKSIVSQIENYLIKSGYDSCTVLCDADLINNEIVLNSVKISIPADYDINEIQKCVFEGLGINAEVYYIGE